MTSESRVWLITGASSGFGHALTQAAAAAGDTVVATARRLGPLQELASSSGPGSGTIDAVQLDVTDPDAVRSVVADIEARHGRIDVLVNNAGHGQVGAVEETTDEELRSLFELHFFGAAALTRAVLPGMRGRGTGTIVQISSMGGQLAYPGFSAYCATKFALEGFSEALAAEVKPLGIDVIVVEPGAFRTSLMGGGLVASTPMDVYAPTVGPTREMTQRTGGKEPGDPVLAAQAILSAVGAEQPPLRLPLGDDAVDAILGHLGVVEAEIRTWEKVSRATGFPGSSS